MAQRVEGLVYEYSVDDSELKTSFTQINKLTKQTSRTAIALEKSLSTAFDPTDINAVKDVLVDNEKLMKDLEQETKALATQMKNIDKEAKDFDPVQYEKLERALLEADTQMKKLQNDQKRYNQTIKALETGELDDLPKKYKNASEGIDDLNDSANGVDLDGLNDSILDLSTNVLDATTSMGGLGGLLGGIPSFVNPITGVIATLGLAINGLAEYTENTRTAQFGLGNATDNTSTSMSEQIGVARRLSNTLDIDMAEATTTVREAMATYGDEIKNTSDLMESSLKVFALNADGIIDSGDAYSVASASARNFGLDTQENEILIGKLSRTVESFGRQGEDVLDTYIEWGDTFSSTGQDADEMLTILNTGLLLGARSTDEVANAWNELVLRMGDGTAQAEIENIGLSWDEFNTKFQAGGRDTQEAVLDILNALSDMEDTTQRTASAFNIFGTAGEEFIATTVDNKQTMQELNDEFDRTTAIQESVATATKDNSQVWKDLQTDLNLTGGEVENLKQQFELYGLAGLGATEQTYIVNEALRILGETNDLSSKQVSNMQTAIGVMTGSMQFASTNTDTLKNGIRLLGEQGVITESAVSDLQFATDLLSGSATLSKEQVNNLTSNIQILGERGEYSKGTVTDMTTAINLLGSETATPSEQISALTSVVNDLQRENKLTTKESYALTNAIMSLDDPTTTSSEKLATMREVIEKVGSASGVSDDKIADLTGKIDGATNAAENGTTAQDGLANSMADSKTDIQNASEAIDRLTLAFIESQSPLDRNRIKTQLGADAMDDLESSAQGAGETMGDTTGEVQDYNNTELEDKSASVDVDTSSIDEAETKWYNTIFGSKSAKVEVQQTGASTSSQIGSIGRSIQNATQQSLNRQITPQQNLNLSINYSSSNVRTQADVKYLTTEVSREIARRLK